MQIKYVNRALQRFDSTQVIPTQFVMFTLSVIIGSAILYRDFERKSASDAAKFVAGCGLTFLGVYCITSGRSREDDGSDADEESDEGEEEISQVEIGSVAGRRSSLAVPRPPERTISSRSDGPLIFAQEIDSDQSGHAAWNSVVAPSARAAIHSDPSDTLTTKPALHATTSEPVLPATTRVDTTFPELRDADLTSPLLRAESRLKAHSRPQTPEMRSPQLEPTTPANIATTPRFGSIGRHSITDLLPHPGPFTNPLSNSLTAIVADSIRRGVDFRPGAGTIRRKSLRQKRSARFPDGLGWAAAVREEGSGQDTVQAEGSGLGISPVKDRPVNASRQPSQVQCSEDVPDLERQPSRN